VLPGLDAAGQAERLDDYARRVSHVHGIRRVDGASGSYTEGRRVAAPSAASARFSSPAGTWLSVVTSGEAYSPENSEIVGEIRALPAPAHAEVGGPSARLADILGAIRERLPLALALVAVMTLVLISAMTRSPVLAVKALLMKALGLAATFGVVVHIFQEGHLRGLVGEFTPAGATDALMPGLVFCIAFGLSMDSEVFLLSGIEEHRRTGGTAAAMALGLERTGRQSTSAALLVAVVMASLATSSLVMLKMVGVGVALAVVLDATLVRGLLVPAVMRLAGDATWWSFRRPTVR
jgi:RND superfamily putative drug exporter